MDNPCTEFDRAKAAAEFDQTKAGVKGLIDRGLTKVPRIFIEPPENLSKAPKTQLEKVPVIDMRGFEKHGERRRDIVKRIGEACSRWGIFMVVNHGVGVEVMEEMLEGVRGFHEQDKEVKREWYSRDVKRAVRYYSNGNLFVSKAAANWRDSIAFEYFHGSTLEAEAMPLICRDRVSKYMKEMNALREALSELVSEALGLDLDHLSRMGYMENETLVCHYYPACPEPDLTLGASKHSDPSFLTVLLQDSTMGGLQVLHQDQWVDVVPVHGALVIHIGDLLQLISNDRFRSAEHRVVLDGQSGRPRVSAACFFRPSSATKLRPYGPIMETLSTNNCNCTPLYRETHITEYLAHYRSKGLDGTSALPFPNQQALLNSASGRAKLNSVGQLQLHSWCSAAQ